MFQYFRSMLTSSKTKKEQPRIRKGQRVYAIGDIHGRGDLFAVLKDAIEEDARDAEADGKDVLVILLGDLVDRGPDSAGVIETARKWRKQRDVRILMGNHEEMFLDSFQNKETLRHFMRHGGRETLMSYGVDKKTFTKASLAELQLVLNEVVPEKHRKFVSKFEDMVLVDDYLFVHAGIEPGVSLEDQKKRHLRWIREPFLSHKGSHGPVVVHGHTITEDPVDAGNRIGIDTGAYSSGRLTALVLEGRKRRFITVRQAKSGKIKTEGLREPA